MALKKEKETHIEKNKMKDIPEPKKSGLEHLLDNCRNLKNMDDNLRKQVLDYMTEHPDYVLVTILCNARRGTIPIIHRFYERKDAPSMIGGRLKGMYPISIHTKSELELITDRKYRK